jgi:hypothetical protein
MPCVGVTTDCGGQEGKNMRDRERLWATVVIWVAFIGFLAGFLMPEDTLFGNVAFLSIAAAISTAVIWGVFQRRSHDSEQDVTAHYGKLKHSSRDRLRRMVEQLDDDEIIELESLLIVEDDLPYHKANS